MGEQLYLKSWESVLGRSILHYFGEWKPNLSVLLWHTKFAVFHLVSIEEEFFASLWFIEF